MSGPRDLLLDDVSAGQELPPLSVDVSATTIILGALASRDWRPMHHDRDFAQKRNGVRDIFIRAATVVDAARIARDHGTIARLDRADVL